MIVFHSTNTQPNCGENPETCLVHVQGSVTILNHPKLGKTPGSSLHLVFQKTDCKRCLISVPTQIDGSYGISIGPGEYRVILSQGDTARDSRDMLAPGQPRKFRTGPTGSNTRFDVQVLIPPEQ